VNVNRTELAYHKAHWWTSVNMDVNLQVLFKCEFLDCLDVYQHIM
jgi:hypothetical protein